MSTRPFKTPSLVNLRELSEPYKKSTVGLSGAQKIEFANLLTTEFVRNKIGETKEEDVQRPRFDYFLNRAGTVKMKAMLDSRHRRWETKQAEKKRALAAVVLPPQVKLHSFNTVGIAFKEVVVNSQMLPKPFTVPTIDTGEELAQDYRAQTLMMRRQTALLNTQAEEMKCLSKMVKELYTALTGATA